MEDIAALVEARRAETGSSRYLPRRVTPCNTLALHNLLGAREDNGMLEIVRGMRRRPFISAFAMVVVATLLVLAVGRPLLVAIAAPEVLLALLGANLVLTALVGRIIRKVFISRSADHQAIAKAQLRALEDRVLQEIRRNS